MEQNSLKCPNCGRNLTESELYCYFCEIDLAETAMKKEKRNGIRSKTKARSKEEK